MIFESKQSSVSPEEKAKQEHQRKLDSDPTRQNLREEGFQGNPNVFYSMDIISSKNSKGEVTTAKQIFDNFEDMKKFIIDNPDSMTQQQKDRMKEGIPPFKTDYDKSIYDWSKTLSPEQKNQSEINLNNRFNNIFDPRKWESKEEKNKPEQATEKPKEKTPDDIQSEIIETENQSLQSLYNPEILKTIGGQYEIDNIIRTMSAHALAFQNSEEKTGASLAKKELQEISKLLKNGSYEELLKADKIFTGYINRRISQKFNATLNNPNISIPWEDKDKMLNISSVTRMMGIRAEGMSTHDIIEQEKIMDEIIGKYKSKSKTPEIVKGKEQKQEIKPKFEKVTNENFELYYRQKKEVIFNGQAWRIDEVRQDGSIFLHRDMEISEAIRLAERTQGEKLEVKKLLNLDSVKIKAIQISLEELKSDGQWIVEKPPRSTEDPERQKEVAEAASLQKRLLSGEFNDNKNEEFDLLADVLTKKALSLNAEKLAYEKTLFINNPK